MNLVDALAALHRAGRIRSPWLPGMHALALDLDVYWNERHFAPPGPWTPDLTDPATLGCLLALVREASGAPRLFVSSHHGGLDPEQGGGWEIGWREDYSEIGGPDWVHELMEQPTEGEALAAALVALAEGL